MKKYSFLLLLAAGLFFVACKKEYTCECTITQTIDGQTSVSNSTSYLYESSEKKARSECETDVTQNIGLGGMTGSQTVSCRLK
jgi:hypothetical protein